MQTDVAIVGAGLAGLACARALDAAGRSVVVLEAQDGIGGRVRTDRVDGFLLDRGFQVLSTAYPEVRSGLDLVALDVGRFYPGALVRVDGRFVRVADPFRRPWDALRGLLAPVGSIADKLRVLRLRRRACSGSLEDLLERPETRTIDFLTAAGFSRRMIDRFWRPFLGGIFLERELATSSRKTEFALRAFASGDACLPASGMGAIAKQVAAALPAGAIRLRSRVEAITDSGVRLVGGETVEATKVVVATEGPATASLVGVPDPGSISTTCVYYAAPRSPIREPVLVLDGEGAGPVNNVCVPTDVSPSYSRSGESLVSCTVLGERSTDDDELDHGVRAQMCGWFGPEVDDWRRVRTYRIRHALPLRARFGGAVGRAAPDETLRPLPSKTVVCGDWLDVPSLQGAMRSGRLAAQAVLAR
jgi:phytoene dehydrogenase-like protein